MFTRKAFLVALVLAGIVGCTAQGGITPIQSPASSGAPTAPSAGTTSTTPGASSTAPMPAMSGMGDMPASGTSSTATATAGPAAMTQSVTIQNFAFSPANVTVMRGGTFPYHCSVHPSMHGTITVQ